jgi:enoyl-CoA hydratase
MTQLETFRPLPARDDRSVTDSLVVEHPASGVAVITLNRPRHLNPLGWSEITELPRVLRGFEDTGAVVLTGAGRAFCAGADITAFADAAGPAERARFATNAMACLEAIERAPFPVIAAVNGIAYGGGMELTIACDLVIASPDARFAFKEITLGLVPPYGLLRGPAVIGRRWTARLALTGEVIDATTAQAIGLVQDTVPAAELLTRAVEMAREIAEMPRAAAATVKRVLNRDLGSSGVTGVLAEGAVLSASEDHRSRVARFLHRD